MKSEPHIRALFSFDAPVQNYYLSLYHTLNEEIEIFRQFLFVIYNFFI